MDVEKIQKVNALAKELMDHGFAADLNEAVNKATNMIDKKEDNLNQAQPQEVQSIEPQQQVNNFQAEDSARDKESGMSWQQAMTKNNEYIVNLLKDFQSKLDKMTTKIDKLSNRPVQQIVQQVEEPKPSQQRLPVQEEKKVPHVRSGSFVPGSDDVSVDKIFYFGNK